MRFSWMETLARTTRHFPNISRFIDLLQPDVIGLVEVDAGSYRARRQNQAEEIGQTIGYQVYSRVKYPDYGIGRKMPVLKKQANAVLTRLPVCSFHFHDFSNGFKSLAIEIRFESFTFFLVHLALGIRARHKQLLELHQLIASAPRPRIVAGDFNTLTGSWEMQMFLSATGLTSANILHKPTYPSWQPRRELDFICYDEGIVPIRFKMPRVHLSDHCPLIFDFRLPGDVSEKN